MDREYHRQAPVQHMQRMQNFAQRLRIVQVLRPVDRGQYKRLPFQTELPEQQRLFPCLILEQKAHPALNRPYIDQTVVTPLPRPGRIPLFQQISIPRYVQVKFSPASRSARYRLDSSAILLSRADPDSTCASECSSFWRQRTRQRRIRISIHDDTIRLHGRSPHPGQSASVDHLPCG